MHIVQRLGGNVLARQVNNRENNHKDEISIVIFGMSVIFDMSVDIL